MRINTIKRDNEILKWVEINANIIALLCCVAVSVFIAVMPHIVTFIQYGTLDYLADGDDVLYLAISRPPYYGENLLRDPFASLSEHIPTLYSWLQFVPLAKLAHLLGFPLILTSLLWRIIGGIFLGFSLFSLFKLFFLKTHYPIRWALICTIICLCDPGFIGGKSFIQSFINLGNLFLHHELPGKIGNMALPQYRIVTPLLNLPLLILLACIFSPTSKRNYQVALCGTILLGICFRTYFFFWTAATSTLSFYLLIQLLLAWKNKFTRQKYLSEARFTLVILLGGFLIGYPEIVADSTKFADPSFRSVLDRMIRGLHIPQGNPIRSQYIFDMWTWSKLAISTIATLVFKISGLEIIILFTLSGYLLKNSAFITGLEFENFHWNYVSSPFGEISLLVVIVMCFERYFLANWKMLFLIYILPVLLFIGAIFWRPYESLNAIEPRLYNEYIMELRAIQPNLAKLERDCVLSGPFVTNVALLYSQCGQLYSFDQTQVSSLISNLELHERHALNAWLIGFSREEYRKLSDDANTFQFLSSLRPEFQLDTIRKTRMEIFDGIMRKNSSELLLKYHPNYLLLSSTANAPQRGGSWSLIAKSTKWNLWSRKNSSPLSQ